MFLTLRAPRLNEHDERKEGNDLLDSPGAMCMKTKAKYRFVEFIRPDCYWPQPYTLEQAFGVFAWMLRTGEGYGDQSCWGRSSILSLLSGKPSCVNFSAVDPIRSVDDLRRRFHYALLSSCVGESLKLWRSKFDVRPDGNAIISFPHHGWRAAPFDEHRAEIAVNALLNSEGRLGVQLNEFHSRAREILGVDLHWRGSYRFVLNYGYGYEGSVWRHLLARQLPRESFYAVLGRAQKKLSTLVDGKLNSEQAA